MTDGPCATDALPLTISFFRSEGDTQPARRDLTWGELRAELGRFSLRDDKAGPAWSPVRYAEGASRGSAGVEIVTAAVMDVDDGTDPETVHRRLTGLGLEHFIHSTFSSTPEHPKFRVVVPLANPCSAQRWRSVFPGLCALLTDGHTDPGTRDPARLFYLPSARPDGKTFTYAGHGRALLSGDLSHGTIIATAGSLAARIAGISEERLIELVEEDLAYLPGGITSYREEIREATRSALAKFGRPAPEEPKPTSDGPALFREVRETLEQHYHFEQPWHAVLCSLFVSQAHLARALPATFYLIVKGRYGGGKTSLLNVLGKLGNGLVFENVSVAALARELGEGRLVCIDEFDVKRPVDVQPVLDSLVRQGYRRDSAPYTRYDATRHEVERIPVYGPKALTIRSFLDPALESRGFIISASPVEGEEAYGFVVRNLWSDVGDLPTRLARWAAQVAPEWPDSRLRAVAESPELAAKRHQVLETTGANRDTEQVLVALLVAEIAGVDVAAELRAAVELRRASVGTEDASDLEDVTEALLAATGNAQDRLMEGSPVLRVWFRELKKVVNRRREERNDPPISDRRLATMLTQVGVSESWKRNPKNRVGYDLPADWVRQLRQGTPNIPHMPNPPDKNDGVRGVRDVRHTPPETRTDPEGVRGFEEDDAVPSNSAPPPGGLTEGTKGSVAGRDQETLDSPSSEGGRDASSTSSATHEERVDDGADEGDRGDAALRQPLPRTASDAADAVGARPRPSSGILPVPVPEEALLGPGPTLANRALANARREGSLPLDPPGQEDS